MSRIYLVGLILYTLIVLHVAFPSIFSFENVETVHVALFTFTLFLIDCCISIWLLKRKHVQDKKRNRTEKEKTFILDDNVLFFFSNYCRFF